MTFTSNDEAVFEAFARTRAARYIDQRQALSSVLYCFPMGLTFTESGFPVFTLPNNHLGVSADDVFVRRVMYTLSNSAASWLGGMAHYFKNYEGGSMTALYPTCQDYLRAEVENRIQLGGNNHFMTILMRGLLEDPAWERFTRDSRPPEGLIAFVD